MSCGSGHGMLEIMETLMNDIKTMGSGLERNSTDNNSDTSSDTGSGLWRCDECDMDFPLEDMVYSMCSTCFDKDGNRRRRRSRLLVRLSRMEIYFRWDSALCWKYIFGKINLPVDVVVEKMAKMHYLYNFTSYGEKMWTHRLYYDEVRTLRKNYPIEKPWPWLGEKDDSSWTLVTK
jgi:hypothetical protein